MGELLHAEEGMALGGHQYLPGDDDVGHPPGSACVERTQRSSYCVAFIADKTLASQVAPLHNTKIDVTQVIVNSANKLRTENWHKSAKTAKLQIQ